MHHLRAPVTKRLYRKPHSPFNTVQVIVQTGAAEHKQRSSNPAKVQIFCKPALKLVLNHFYCNLSCLRQQLSFISLWQY